jgi:AcrR family transcriptional regulator
MGIKERREREKGEMRVLILNAAKEIIKNEGADSLSIRKIAAKIDYSPAIIYHYFEDKDEITRNLMIEGYRRILNALSIPDSGMTPEQKFEQSGRQFINTALNMPDEYKGFMFSDSEGILEFTSILFEGASLKRQALKSMCGMLGEFAQNGSLSDSKLELKAQIIWASTFGLTTRMIIERTLSSEQREKLIDMHIRAMTVLAKTNLNGG